MQVGRCLKWICHMTVSSGRSTNHRGSSQFCRLSLWVAHMRLFFFLVRLGWIGLSWVELDLVSLGISEAITLHLLRSFSLVVSFLSLSRYDQTKNWSPSAGKSNLKQSCWWMLLAVLLFIFSRTEGAASSQGSRWWILGKTYWPIKYPAGKSMSSSCFSFFFLSFSGESGNHSTREFCKVQKAMEITGMDIYLHSPIVQNCLILYQLFVVHCAGTTLDTTLWSKGSGITVSVFAQKHRQKMSVMRLWKRSQTCWIFRSRHQPLCLSHPLKLHTKSVYKDHNAGTTTKIPSLTSNLNLSTSSNSFFINSGLI